MTSGIDSGSSGSRTPVSMASLSGIPDEIMKSVMSFYPDSARALCAVSHALNRTGANFLQRSAGEIAVLCSAGANSPLYQVVCNNFIQFALRPQQERMGIEFLLSIPGVIRSLGAPAEECPDRILTSGEIGQFDRRIQDLCLQRIWGKRLHHVIIANLLPPPVDLPAGNATAEAIRTWLHSDANRPLLLGWNTLWLNGLNLTSLPRETCLFTNLQMFTLFRNRLTLLPEDLYHGMTRLVELDLSHNLLTCLPEGIFRGLTGLVIIHLHNNRLTSLSEGLFHGLIGLMELRIDHNQLLSVPEGLFNGLTGLQRLNLAANQLSLLPGELFNGLTGLEVLFLNHNRLTSLPPGIFNGLTGIRSLYFNNS